jgi:hypothetical protein
MRLPSGEHYGSIFGTIMLTSLGGAAAGPWVTGVLHDIDGTYTAAFVIGNRRQHRLRGRDLAGLSGQGAGGRGPVVPGAVSGSRSAAGHRLLIGLGKGH